MENRTELSALHFKNIKTNTIGVLVRCEKAADRSVRVILEFPDYESSLPIESLARRFRFVPIEELQANISPYNGRQYKLRSRLIKLICANAASNYAELERSLDEANIAKGRFLEDIANGAFLYKLDLRHPHAELPVDIAYQRKKGPFGEGFKLNGAGEPIYLTPSLVALRRKTGIVLEPDQRMYLYFIDADIVLENIGTVDGSKLTDFEKVGFLGEIPANFVRYVLIVDSMGKTRQFMRNRRPAVGHLG